MVGYTRGHEIPSRKTRAGVEKASIKCPSSAVLSKTQKVPREAYVAVIHRSEARASRVETNNFGSGLPATPRDFTLPTPPNLRRNYYVSASVCYKKTTR